MRKMKLIDLPIDWKRGNGLTKSDIVIDGNYKCVLYGELFTKHKKVLIDSFKLSRTNQIGSVKSKYGDILVPGTSTAAKRDMILARELDEEGVFLGGDINIIRPQKNLFAKKFVAYYFETIDAYEQLEGYINGATGIIHISNTGLKNLKIPLPPLSEQEEIVSILDDVFESIERVKSNLEKNLKNAKELFESCLQNMFKNKSDGWTEKTLGEICTTTQGVQIEKSEQLSELLPKYKRYLYISDFKNDKNIKYVKDIYPKKNVTTDDLIVVNTGNSAGDIFKGIDGILSNNLFKVSYNKNIINGQFLYYFVTSKMFRNYQTKIIRGTANPHMGHENFNSTPFSFPLIHDQEIIVKKLDALAFETKKLESIYQQKLYDLEELKKSILQKAFNGELKTSKLTA